MTNTQPLLNTLYQIESKLGSGGGGVVYKAWHTRLQKYVVIKEMKRADKADAGTQRNETEALKNVKSAYLPQVLDFFSENGRAFTVMEYIDGMSLDKFIEQGQNFTQTQVVKWYGQLAAALEAIHTQNIAHRDIKPANIMLLPNGDVCLIDFNAALVNGSDVRLISRSLGYASPEQYKIFEKYRYTANAPIRYTASDTVGSSSLTAENRYDSDKTELIDNTDATELIDDAAELTESRNSFRQDIDKTEVIKPIITENIDWKLSDIYSLGATVYHLLTGIRPSERVSEIKKLSDFGVFDEGLTYIIEKSISPVPSERIPSATMLLEMIRNIYKYDSGWKKLRVKQIAAAVVLPLLFSGCLITSVLGYNKIGQEKEEQFYSEVYAIQNGENPEEAYLNAIGLFEGRIDPYYAMAQRYWKTGDLELCMEYIKSNLGNISKFQSDKDAYEALGGIYYILGDCFYYQTGGDYQNARLNYELALKYASDNAGYCRDYAITLARLGDTDSAKKELSKAQELNLDEVSLNLLNGEIDFANNKLDSALEYFSRVILNSDDDYIRYRAYHSSDEIFKIQGKMRDSIDLLTDSLNKIPSNRVGEMKERLADSYYKNGDNKNAILIFEELAQNNPSYNLQQNLVILYQMENEFEKASELLVKMRNDFPNDYRVPMRQAFLEVDIQSHRENEKRDYYTTSVYYEEAKALYSENVKPGENDPEMQQLEEIIHQLKDNNWIK